MTRAFRTREKASMALQIVWRNPERVRDRQRWEPLKQGPDSTVYLVQQFVSTGEHGLWSTTSSLEMVSKQQGGVVVNPARREFNRGRRRITGGITRPIP